MCRAASITIVRNQSSASPARPMQKQRGTDRPNGKILRPTERQKVTVRRVLLGGVILLVLLVITIAFLLQSAVIPRLLSFFTLTALAS